MWLGGGYPQQQLQPGMPAAHAYGIQATPSPTQHLPQHAVMLPPAMSTPQDEHGDEQTEDDGDTDPEDEAECETLRSQLAAALLHSRCLEAQLITRALALRACLLRPRLRPRAWCRRFQQRASTPASSKCSRRR